MNCKTGALNRFFGGGLQFIRQFLQFITEMVSWRAFQQFLRAPIKQQA
jgi:hypothetical protein